MTGKVTSSAKRVILPSKAYSSRSTRIPDDMKSDAHTRGKRSTQDNKKNEQAANAAPSPAYIGPIRTNFLSSLFPGAPFSGSALTAAPSRGFNFHPHQFPFVDGVRFSFSVRSSSFDCSSASFSLSSSSTSSLVCEELRELANDGVCFRPIARVRHMCLMSFSSNSLQSGIMPSKA